VYSSTQLKWHERTWFAASAFLNALSLSAFVGQFPRRGRSRFAEFADMETLLNGALSR